MSAVFVLLIFVVLMHVGVLIFTCLMIIDLYVFDIGVT